MHESLGESRVLAKETCRTDTLVHGGRPSSRTHLVELLFDEGCNVLLNVELFQCLRARACVCICVHSGVAACMRVRLCACMCLPILLPGTLQLAALCVSNTQLQHCAASAVVQCAVLARERAWTHLRGAVDGIGLPAVMGDVQVKRANNNKGESVCAVAQDAERGLQAFLSGRAHRDTTTYPAQAGTHISSLISAFLITAFCGGQGVRAGCLRAVLSGGKVLVNQCSLRLRVRVSATHMRGKHVWLQHNTTGERGGAETESAFAFASPHSPGWAWPWLLLCGVPGFELE